MKKRGFRITLPMVLLVLWMGVILYFSSDTGAESSLKSGLVMKYIGPIIQKISITIRGSELSVSNLHFIVRKLAHMFNYFMLASLSYLSCYSIKPRKFLSSLFAIVYSTTFALVDEFFQTFVSGRSGSVRDVMIDSIGIYISVFILSILLALLERVNRKKLKIEETA